MREAIEWLGADRIDHGVRAIEDAALVALLAERRIPLGICPTSNLVLGVVASIEAHPIEPLRRAGVPVSISTDDPVLLGASLEGEYALCSAAFRWSDDAVRAIAATSIAASFANDDVKRSLNEALAQWRRARRVVSARRQALDLHRRGQAEIGVGRAEPTA